MGVYRVNQNIQPDDLTYYFGPESPWRLEIETMIAAIEITNAEIQKEYEFNKDRPISLIKSIPKKSLSGSIGEGYGTCLSNLMVGKLAKNTHESSSPDMIPVIPETKEWVLGIKKDHCNFGGFDMKGCVTEGMHFMKVKPSSHHDQTTGVLTVQWKSSENTFAEIIGVYFTRYLERTDWRITRVPKNENSKLTSNATLLPSGVEKVRKGWVAIREDVLLPRKKESICLYGLDSFYKVDSKTIEGKFSIRENNAPVISPIRIFTDSKSSLLVRRT